MVNWLSYKSSLLLFACTALVLSCEKDLPLQIEPTSWQPCDGPPDYALSYVTQYPYEYSAAPDPNRATRVAVAALTGEGDWRGLSIFDRQSQQSYFLPVSPLGSVEMDWGESGWILFVDEMFQINKVNPLDSTVVPLTTGTSQCFYPAWNREASRFAYISFGSETDLVIADANGNESGRVNSVNSAPCWSRDGEKIVAGTEGAPPRKLFWISSDGLGEKHFFYEPGDGWKIDGYDWLPNDKDLVVCLTRGAEEFKLGSVNVETGNFSLWQTGCRSERYRLTKSSRNDGWVYFSLAGFIWNESDSTVNGFSQIWKMDPNGNYLQRATW